MTLFLIGRIAGMMERGNPSEVRCTDERKRIVIQPDLAELRTILRQQLPSLRDRYQVASLGLFGSFVRHQNRPDSDLDVLVTFTEAPSLLRLIELENHLSDLLGIKVDLVMGEALKPQIGRHILAEVVPV
jgi:predicted nucleotidyltransferase